MGVGNILLVFSFFNKKYVPQLVTPIVLFDHEELIVNKHITVHKYGHANPMVDGTMDHSLASKSCLFFVHTAVSVSTYQIFIITSQVMRGSDMLVCCDGTTSSLCEV